jgi:DNA invertase Pin-like site-specific DNA recombinase
VSPRAKKTVPQGDAKKAVAVVRTSTDKQENGVQAQRDAIASWAAREGVEVIGWFEDEDTSGATPVDERDGFLAALGTLKDAGAGVMVFQKRDRIARDTGVAATAEALVRHAGGRILTADGIGAEDTPEGQLMRGLLDLFSQYERAAIRSRIRATFAVKRSRGERLGGPVPYGWRVHPEDAALTKGARRLVPHEGEQKTIRRARELSASGLSLRAIGKQLRAERLAPKALAAESVRRILAAKE